VLTIRVKERVKEFRYRTIGKEGEKYKKTRR
jgi:hypothetical protein